MGLRKIILCFILIISIAGNVIAAQHTSYQECRKCHSDIFKLWNTSLHSSSFSNPTFQTSYMSLLLDEGKEAGKLCLRCHAPVAYLSNDYDLKSSEAAEGVTCWFCHSISSVNQGARIENYYNIDTTGVIYGPYQPSDDIDIDHEIKHSELHLTAEVCAGCHEFVNDNNVGVLETFSEWKKSSYSEEDVYCQNCHMPIMIDLSVTDDKEVSNYYVTAHEFQGGHSRVNLRNAVVLETVVVKNNRTLNVKTYLTNAESGHKLPTGIPIRKLVLEVILLNNNQVEIGSARKVYRKVLTDKYGTIIENAADMFKNATQIFSDNRINPKETRIEEFIFVLPEYLKDFRIVTILNYEFTRPFLKEEFVRIRMAKNIVTSKDIK